MAATAKAIDVRKAVAATKAWVLGSSLIGRRASSAVWVRADDASIADMGAFCLSPGVGRGASTAARTAVCVDGEATTGALVRFRLRRDRTLRLVDGQQVG
jgi:hypothetical protein